MSKKLLALSLCSSLLCSNLAYPTMNIEDPTQSAQSEGSFLFGAAAFALCYAALGAVLIIFAFNDGGPKVDVESSDSQDPNTSTTNTSKK